MQYGSFDWKDKKEFSQKTIPGIASRLTILILIILLAACGDDSGSSNNTPETFTNSSNADLSDLSFHGTLDQIFSTNLYDYTATVAYRFKSVQVTPVTTDENATVTVNGVTVRSGFASSPIGLIAGQNAPILVEVTAEDNLTSKVYRLVVTVEAPSTNADLSSIVLSEGSISPTFDPTITSYSASVEYSISSLNFTLFTTQKWESITINGNFLTTSSTSIPLVLKVGTNLFTIIVTAEDGVNINTYIINVTREVASNNGNLALLAPSLGVLDSIFQPFLTDYNTTVDFLDTTLEIFAVPEHRFASVRVNDVIITAENLSQPVLLGEGSNLVTIEVTAEDGFTRKTYSILVNRQSSSDFIQHTYLKASNSWNGDAFGLSVSLSGDTLAIGARYEDSNATGANGDQANNAAVNSGAAYVFVRDVTGNWLQQAYLKASNPESFPGNFWDIFGQSVSLSGNTLAVGAPGEDSNATGVDGDQSNNASESSGAVYVFARDSSNQWSQQAYLKASNTGAGIWFGNSVSLSGDTLAVGAHRESNLGSRSGAVYVFTRDGNNQWSQQAYLKASNTGFGDFFGFSVALSGNTLAVGAYAEDSNATGVDGIQSNNSEFDSGAVYVFTRDGNNQWSQQAYLKASNTGPSDLFGYSVALSGDSLAVGAHGEDSNATGVDGIQSNNSATQSGAVYVFTRDSIGRWLQQAYLKASNTGSDDRFGSGASLSGNILAVGASGEDSNATGVDGDETNNLAFQSGAVYLFTRDVNTWSQQAYIKASNTGISESFGSSVTLSSDTLAVGAWREDSNATGVNGNQANNGATDSGAVYVYQ